VASELEEFFDLSVDLLCVTGFDGYFRRVNPAFERLLGYPREQLFARTVFDITHPDDRERAREALERSAGGSDLIGIEVRVVCADGSARWLEWNTRAAPERGVVYGVARDTTERRRADAALRDAHGRVEALAAEQMALRRVATLVAEGASPDEVSAAVGREAGMLLDADAARIVRYVGDELEQLPGWVAPGFEPLPTGRVKRDDAGLAGQVHRTGRTARIDDHGGTSRDAGTPGIHSAVAAPVFVGGRLWGALLTWLMRPARMPDQSEGRLAGFTELVATAVANSATRAELDRVLAEQAALRRVAELVAHEAPPDDVLAAVTREIGELMGIDATDLARFDDDDTVVSIARQGRYPGVPLGARFPLDGDSVSARVWRTGRSARMDGSEDATGAIAATVSELGLRSRIGVPISVGGRTWGVVIASTKSAEPLAAEMEGRLARFTELAATAIANADSRDQLTASRARVLAAGDDARRRVVRDLHDGAQQRLVHTILTLKLAQRALRDGDGADAGSLLADALASAEHATAELRELAHGILPAVLARGGLRAGVKAFVAWLDLDVDVDVAGERFTPDLEASAYFIVAEALTNVVKHARASRASVTARLEGDTLALAIRDDGVGGADPDGHGLLGVADRVDALGGTLRIESGAAGTLVEVRLPSGRLQ
jgi:PAS domain S-box-containing protein